MSVTAQEPLEGSSGQSRVAKSLLDTRRELIDLTRRKRLLDTSRTDSRPHCFEILAADPNRLFVGLGRTISTGKARKHELCTMKTPKHSLRKIVSFLNNPDEDGGFWLPNIQRPFVWSEEQMCRLFDSILREYPISTLLVWKTKSKIRRRKFIDNWKDSLRLSDFYVPEDAKKKCLVLDGQQRLQ